MNAFHLRTGKNSLKVKGLARARFRAGLMLCTLLLVCTWVRAGEGARQVSVRVIYDDERKTATVAVTGAKILDQDLKLIRMPAETERFSICDASTSLISREGFAEALAGLPVKELFLSCYRGENVGFLQALEDMQGLRKVHLNLSQLSDAWILALGKVKRVHEGGLELSVSVVDGESISQEVLLQMDGLAAFSAIRLSANLHEAPLIQMAKEQSGKLKRVSVVPADVLRGLRVPPGAN